MGGCCGREQSQPNPLIPDVEQIIADDAWEEFVFVSRRQFRCKRLLMKRSDYVIEVPMNYYHFEETSQRVDPMEHLTVINNAASRAIAEAGQSKMKGKLAHQDKTSPDCNRLETRFRNDTDKTQTYSFRFEKTRTASVEVTYQRGFSIGAKANFSVGVPALGLEGEMRYEVTKSTGQKFEESLVTEANSDVRVSRHSKCIATVVMEEKRLSAKFEVDVTMSMPEGEALVFIKNKDGKVVFVKQINNLSLLFPGKNHIEYKDEDGKDRVRTDAVMFVVKGIVEGTQLSTHHIRLKSRKLHGTNVKEIAGASDDSEEDDDDDDDDDKEEEMDDRQLS